MSRQRGGHLGQRRLRLEAISIFIAIIALATACGSTTTGAVPEETGASTTTKPKHKKKAAPPAKTVGKVVDGDTIRMKNGARIRLVQIDAPELGQGECYAQRSAQDLHRLIPPGTVVRLVADPKLDDVDQYGRRLRYVFKGKKNVNVALVRQGAAAPWFYGGDLGKHATKLMAAAEAAKAEPRGLWKACSATVLDPFSGLETRKPAPPPPPPPPPPKVVSPPPPPAANCHPSYEGACLDPNSSDYDCAGGSGNGPDYTGTVKVVGYDEYGLDADGDGYGCE